jgi:hypothetical protein
MRITRIQQRPATSLVEMLLVMALLLIGMVVGVAAITGLLRVEKAANDASQRLTERMNLASQFRTDVSQSVAAPEKADDEMAGPTCLLLRKPDGAHIVYRWSEGRLRRRDSREPAEGAVVLTAEGATVEFKRTDGDPARLTLHLTEMIGRQTSARLTEITATLGGDLR